MSPRFMATILSGFPPIELEDGSEFNIKDVMDPKSQRCKELWIQKNMDARKKP